MHAAGKVGAAWAVPGVHAPYYMVIVAWQVQSAGKETLLAQLIATHRKSAKSRFDMTADACSWEGRSSMGGAWCACAT